MLKAHLMRLSFLVLVTCILATRGLSQTLARQLGSLPPLEDPPSAGADSTMLRFPLQVISPKVGLLSVLTDGVKVLSSDVTGVEAMNWYLRHAEVVDEEASLFSIGYDVVVPASDAARIDESFRQFVGDGLLEKEFESAGLSGLAFRIDPNTPTEQPTGANAVPSPSEEPVPSEPEPPPFANATELTEMLPGLLRKEEYSRPLDVFISSPIMGFPEELRDGIKWFMANITETELQAWYMPYIDVWNQTVGEYEVVFLCIGQNSTTDAVLNQTTEYVDSGTLTAELLDSNAPSVNVSLLPVKVLAEPQPSPEAEREGDSVPIEIYLHVSARRTGLADAVSDVIKQGVANSTFTKSSHWELTALTTESTRGPYIVNYATIVAEGTEVEAIRNVTVLVRSRELDEVFKELGFADVGVRLQPRLTQIGEIAGSDASAITSTVATVVASVAGMIVVVAIGAGILCLLPRGDAAFDASWSEARELDGRDRRRSFIMSW